MANPMRVHQLPLRVEQEVTTAIVDVTPEIALDYLGKNPNNRAVKPAKVAKYARDMAANNWPMTGESIKFDDAGNLLDGQHRCLAVIQSGATVRMLVVQNVKREAQDYMDTGSARTAADALKMHGVKQNALVSAAVKIAICWETGQLRNSMVSRLEEVSHADVFKWLDRNPGFYDVVPFAASLRHSIPARPSVIAFTVWEASKIDTEAAQRFFSDLAEMRTDGIGDPRRTLLNRLNNAKAARQRVEMSTEVYAVFRAWNAWRAGEKLHQIKVGNAEGYYKIVPPR